MNPRRRPPGQKFLDHFAAMNRGSVPKDQQLARDVAQQELEKLDHIRPFIRPFQHRHVEFTLGRDAAHRRKMVVAQVLLDHRGLAHRGVGAQRHWQQVEPRLVGEHQGPLLLYSFF